MNRLIGLMAVFCFVLAFGCITTFAADNPAFGGIYDLNVEESYVDTITVTAQAEDGTVISGDSSVTIDGNPVTFYGNAVKFGLAYSGNKTSNYYLTITLNDGSVIPTESNIVYIDQNETAEFVIYPSILEMGKTYSICISGSGSDFTSLTKVASFKCYQPFLLGDADLNDKVNINDAMAVINHITKTAVLSGNGLLAADVDGNKSVNINDAMAIINYITKTSNIYNLKDRN